MRILVIGGDGMLGHQLLIALAPRHEVRASLRRPLPEYAAFGLFTSANAYGGIDVRDARALDAVLRDFRPDAVINAAGIIKQRDAAEDAVASIEVNALFPHRLARLCAQSGAYLVHYSTDCVFSGRSGNYSESDLADPADFYGKSKLLGEPQAQNGITLRTSMIGFELGRKASLLEWFLSSRGKVRGYRRAVFSGLSTLEHARIVERVLLQQPRKAGLYHVSAAPISKLDLLSAVKRHFGLDLEIEPDDAVAIDRSLDSTRFQRDFRYAPPGWEEMIAELAAIRRAARR